MVKTKPKHLLFRVLAISLMVSHYFTVLLIPQTAHAFSGRGEGSAQYPFQIVDCSGLQEMSNNMSGYYIVMNDIDCSGSASWNSGAGFAPIGNNNSRFTGTLDGQNFTISGLTINRPSTNYVGIFGGLSGTVKNIHFTSASVTGGANYVAILTSYAVGATIQDVSVAGNATGGSVVAGIAAYAGSSSTITRTSYSGSTTATSSWGGSFVTFAGDSTISDNYANVDITSANSSAGLVTSASSTSGHTMTISNNYVTGTVNDNNYRAALVGFVSSGGTTDITNNFVVVNGENNGSPAGIGMFSRVDSGTPNVTGNYYDQTVAATTYCATGFSCNAVNTDGSDGSHFKGNNSVSPLDQWDFTTVWQTTADYPTLRAGTPGAYADPVPPSAPGNLTAYPQHDGMGLGWDTPSDGHSPLTGYSLQMREHGTTDWNTVNNNIGGGGTGIGIGGGGLIDGASFDFRVAAINAVGTGAYAEIDNVLVGDVPDAPTNLVGVNGQTSVGGTWDAPANTGYTAIDHYEFAYSLTGQDAWNTYNVVGTSAGVNGVNSGAYDIRVRAVNANGPSSWTYAYNFYVGPVDYNITTCDQLQAMQNEPTGDYTLANNIDCSATTGWNGGDGFMPITDFGGSLNGNGFTISNLFIHRTGDYDQGLFSNLTDGAYIYNLHLTGLNVTAYGGAGGIASYMDGSVTIYNVSVTGTLTANWNVGGILGSASIGSGNTLGISDVTTDITINASSDGGDFGGIVGYVGVDNSSATIQNSSSTLAFNGNDNFIYSTGGVIGDTERYDNSHMTISNVQVNLSNINIRGTDIGGVIGYDYGQWYDTGTPAELAIDGALVSGDLQARYDLGGLIGTLENYGITTAISQSRFYGSITGSDNAVGGLVGYAYGSDGSFSIDQSLIDAAIHGGTDTIGGLVAYAGILTTISNSYAKVDLAGTDYVGGLVGSGYVDISNSYVAGIMNSSGWQLGGLVGEMYDGTVTNSFSALDMSGTDYLNKTTNGGLIGAQDAGAVDGYLDASRSVIGCRSVVSEGATQSCQLANESNSQPNYFFSNHHNAPLDQWDFSTTWSTINGDYPDLIWNANQDDPIVYDITTCDQLQDVNRDLSGHFYLASDIDCSESADWNGGAGFTPIGQDSADGFTGAFDGNGYTISNLYINQPDSTQAGLFAHTTGPWIVGFSLTNATIIGQYATGSIIGQANNTVLLGVQVSQSTVSSSAIDALEGGATGGLVGLFLGDGAGMYGGQGLSFQGDVTGTGAVGGLFGLTNATIFFDSFADAHVTGLTALGGVIGAMNSTTFINGYSAGRITTLPSVYAPFAGGFSGYTGTATIQNVFSVSQVDLVPEYDYSTNALVGVLADTDTNIIHSYYNSDSGSGHCSYYDTDWYDSGDCTGVSISADPTHFMDNSSDAPLDQWSFGHNSIWHIRHNDYPNLTPLQDPYIICEAPSSTNSSISVHCDYAPQGWGITTWEMQYRKVGETTWHDVTLANAEVAQATISGLTAGTTYQVRFRFSNDWDTSDWGMQEITTTGSAPSSASKAATTTPAITAAVTLPSEVTKQITADDTKLILDDFAGFNSGQTVELDLKLGQVVYFYVNGELHSATVKELGADYVILTIASDPFDVRLSVGASQDVSINHNNDKQLQIGLISVQNGTAHLRFARIMKHNASTSSNQTNYTYLWFLLALIPVAYLVARAKKR